MIGLCDPAFLAASALTPAEALAGMSKFGTAIGLWNFQSPETVYSDPARTTPVADDDPVRGIADLSGAGNHLSTYDDSKPPVFFAAGKGVRLKGWLPTSLRNTALAWAGDDYTLLLAAVPLDANLEVYVSQQGFLFGENDEHPSVALKLNAGGSTRTPMPQMRPGLGSVQIMGLQSLGIGCSIVLNGTSGDAGPSDPIPQTGWQIGALNVQFGANMLVRAAVLYSPALNSSALAAAQARLALISQVGIIYSGDRPLLLFRGNSLTYGIGLTGAAQGPYGLVGSTADQVAGLLGNPVTIANYGVSGVTTTAFLAEDTTQSLFSSIRAKNVAILTEVTNDIYKIPGLTAAQAYANIVAWATTYKAVGWQVIVETPTPSNLLNSGQETVRLAVLDLMRADTNNWDALSDPAADPTIGPPGAQNNTTYYVDGTHHTAAGYAIRAGLVQAALATLGIT